MNRFISDLHLGHVNCLAFDNRPFTSIEEQDEYIISKWNDTVDIKDDVYILGDISWYNATRTTDILRKLNGNLHLIVGNHDTKLLRCKELRDEFVEITDYKELYLNADESVILCHYPIPCFKNHYYGWYHLYGHVHTSFEYNMMNNVVFQMKALYDKPCKMFNVGAMLPYIKYVPRTLDEIILNQEENCV